MTTTTPDQETELTAAQWIAELTQAQQTAVCLVAEELDSPTHPKSRYWLNDTVNDFAKVMAAETGGSTRELRLALSVLAARCMNKLASLPRP
jgi:hypothetical protein